MVPWGCTKIRVKWNPPSSGSDPQPSRTLDTHSPFRCTEHPRKDLPLDTGSPDIIEERKVSLPSSESRHAEAVSPCPWLCALGNQLSSWSQCFVLGNVGGSICLITIAQMQLLRKHTLLEASEIWNSTVQRAERPFPSHWHERLTAGTVDQASLTGTQKLLPRMNHEKVC
jgi:hypothetical protein